MITPSEESTVRIRSLTLIDLNKGVITLGPVTVISAPKIIANRISQPSTTLATNIANIVVTNKPSKTRFRTIGPTFRKDENRIAKPPSKTISPTARTIITSNTCQVFKNYYFEYKIKKLKIIT